MAMTRTDSPRERGRTEENRSKGGLVEECLKKNSRPVGEVKINFLLHRFGQLFVVGGLTLSSEADVCPIKLLDAQVEGEHFTGPGRLGVLPERMI